MGLECSHGAFLGSYSSFSGFRRAICRAIGIDENDWAECKDWSFSEGYSPETNPGLWELLNHPDCWGEISPELCRAIAIELTEFVLPELVKSGDGEDLFDGGYAAICLQFISGCRSAANLNECLIFG